jgi:NAD(P)-dependent dehydrogenase (short-subunit alcohol dehydrogenase family)
MITLDQPLSNGRLAGKVAVVTGASSGIGRAAARRFAREGARVFMTSRRPAELADAVREVGENARGVAGDMSNLDDIDRLFAVVREEAGLIDVVFANAGGGEFMRLVDMTEAHYERTFAINVKGTLFTIQKALPLLRDGSSIILTGSTTSIKGTPAFSVYSASKAAIRNLARSWIIELAPRGIRVNVLAPGATATPGWRGLSTSDEEHENMRAQVAAATPLGRLGTVDEAASAALFLASDESSYVNGIELFVDGGAAQI